MVKAKKTKDGKGSQRDRSTGRDEASGADERLTRIEGLERRLVDAVGAATAALASFELLVAEVRGTGKGNTAAVTGRAAPRKRATTRTTAPGRAGATTGRSRGAASSAAATPARTTSGRRTGPRAAGPR